MSAMPSAWNSTTSFPWATSVRAGNGTIVDEVLYALRDLCNDRLVRVGLARSAGTIVKRSRAVRTDISISDAGLHA